MIFNSLTFAVFFAVVLMLHALPFPWRVKKFNLLIASYLFYAAWNPPFVILLWLSTAVDWWVAGAIHRTQAPGRRRALLIVSLATNLGLLGYFKYGDFLLANWQALMAGFGLQWQPPGWEIVLPVGISFYTFQTLSYTLDVYLRRSAPTRSLLDFSLFVTFFPQLVAGPIVRAAELVPQFATPRTATANQFFYGMLLITLGLFEKVVLADGFLGPAVEGVYGMPAAPGALDAWIATVAFSGQIFCDFAGYSLIAIGTALCLGFQLPDNFRFPYAAIGFSDFWRRWHVSLSTWLRDYVYIPLGGNRHGAWRTYAALMGTMLLGGLWHGAAWTFVVWGGLHGLYLALERVLRSRFPNYRPGPAAGFALALATFVLVCVAWVFFRASGFGEAARILTGMAGGNADARPMLPATDVLIVAAIMGALLLTHWLMRRRSLESLVAATPRLLLLLAWAAMAFAVLIEQGQGDAFIYFQF